MDNEINEMIQNRIDDIYQSGEYIYQAKELEEILIYITNLQSQLEEKTYLYNKLDTESKYVITNLQQRIDKAVEYIENHTENIDRGRYYEDYVETYELLNILKGDDTNG